MQMLGMPGTEVCCSKCTGGKLRSGLLLLSLPTGVLESWLGERMCQTLDGSLWCKSGAADKAAIFENDFEQAEKELFPIAHEQFSCHSMDRFPPPPRGLAVGIHKAGKKPC